MAQVKGLYQEPIDWGNLSYDEFHDILEDINRVNISHGPKDIYKTE